MPSSRSLEDLFADRPDLTGTAVAEIAFPGELRERLIAAYLDGTKTAGSSLLLEYEIADEPLPVPGDRSIMVDSQRRPVALLTVSAVDVVPMDEVDLRIAVGEGEGFASVDQWRAAHMEFWTSDDFRDEIGDPAFTPADDAPVVVEWVELGETF
ncbi:ASCH domain-containing protein [Patulibacter sp.]|uniref:ASCH domain-containing protein n=1 Tax=Patulibacter sp. TaxID=1912859 RepID=UPI00271641D6|nr:ASCH domain-containing protein [Patulibacter sp.]MDO9406952.1 ASCH domain-containing protein [Patulibacter sp.]